jgi:hypothetical protein
MSFDLNELDVKSTAEAGTKVTFENPFTKEPLVDDDSKPYYVKIMGGDAGKVSAALRAIADRRVELLRVEGQKFITNEQSRQEDFDTMAAATLEWHLPPIDGAEWPCTEENAKKLYADPRFPWIMEKLEKTIGDRRAFFRKSSAK